MLQVADRDGPAGLPLGATAQGLPAYPPTPYRLRTALPSLDPGLFGVEGTTCATVGAVTCMASPTASPVAVSQEAFARLAVEVQEQAAALQQQAAASSAGIAKCQAQLAALSADVNRNFAGYGVWETTAFFVAIFVAVYTLVPDPTGEQHARDVSEVRVFRQWLTAMANLFFYLCLVIGVLAQQCAAGWRGKDVGWLFALMLAPWAPVLDRAVLTVCATPRVLRMMRDRGGRNRLTAMLREYLHLGEVALSAARVAHVLGFVRDNVPRMPDLDALPVEDSIKDDVRHDYGLMRNTYGDTPESRALLLLIVALSALQPPWYRRWTPVSWLSLSGLWSGHSNGGVADGPAGRLVVPSPLDAVEPTLTAYQQARVFDAIDGQLSCGTVSERRLNQLPQLLCGRCRLAVRAAVEAYLESSGRRHVVIDAPEWFRTVRFCFHTFPSLTSVLGVMWQAAILDNAGLPIEAVPALSAVPGGSAAEACPVDTRTGGESGPSDRRFFSEGLSSVDATRHVFLVLFVLARSLLGEEGSLAAVGAHVKGHLRTNARWAIFARHLSSAPRADQVEVRFNSAMRATTAEEIRNILELFCDSSPTGTVMFRNPCSDSGCCLHVTPALELYRTLRSLLHQSPSPPLQYM